MRSPCSATKSSPQSPQLEKAHGQQRRPNAAKNKLKKKKKERAGLFSSSYIPLLVKQVNEYVFSVPKKHEISKEKIFALFTPRSFVFS